MADPIAVLVAARNEADRVGETVAALRGAFPGAAIWVADDASTDDTDGDLGASAAALVPLVDAVGRGECDLAVAAFRRRVGGGFGVALGFAHWAIRRGCGLETTAPISGQRAMRVEVLRATLPFAAGYGMEVGMTIDAVRAGHTLREYELDLSHRATGRNLAGFVHRARQLRDFARAYRSRRG